ncbi:hypothetical protein [Fuchsiella alkaliacetigena]|uniref:hypothetical protein n=1 Tax=Fuchsiella alkaliacetigena TaxID=957042 RepID=UPI00200B32AD|nr:hypothetical protein [Fuchsiella alkaliacetigena]MCK8823833.1 hypothetical protein [Fuchsiella alkaliacetigena]
MLTTAEQYSGQSCGGEIYLTMSDDSFNIEKTPEDILIYTKRFDDLLESNNLLSYLANLLDEILVNSEFRMSDLERMSDSKIDFISDDEIFSTSEDYYTLYEQIINKYRNSFHKYTYTTLEGRFRTSSGEAILLSSLGDYYDIRNWQEVGEFLVEHPYLQDVLFEAKDKIQEYFGDTKIVLTKEVDPEISDLTCLYAYIHASIPFDEALEKVKQIEYEWYIENMDRINGRFFIDVTCR